MSPRRPKRYAPWRAKRRRILGITALVTLVLLPAVIWRANLASRAREALAKQSGLGRLAPGPWDESSAETLSRSAPRIAATVGEPPDLLRAFLPWSVGNSEALPDGHAWTAEVWKAAEDWVSASDSVLFGPETSSGDRPVGEMWGRPWDDARQRAVDLAFAAAMVYGNRGDGSAAGRALQVLSALGLEPEIVGPEARIPAMYALIRAVEFLSARVPLDPKGLDQLIASLAPDRQLGALAERARLEQRIVLSRMKEGRRRDIRRLVLLAIGVGDLNAIASARITDLVVAWCEAAPGDRPALVKDYHAHIDRISGKAGLYGTVRNVVSGLPGQNWESALDHLVVARAGLAAWRVRKETGRFPDSLDSLAGRLPEGALALFSDGSALRVEQLPGGVDVVGGTGTREIRFRVRFPEA